MSQIRELERAAEKALRELKTTNTEVVALIKTIKQIEDMAADADLLDMKNSTSLKNNLTRLQEEVTELTRNLNALEREMSDTNSKIRKALR